MTNFVVIRVQAGMRYLTGFLDARLGGHDNVSLLQPVLMNQVPVLPGPCRGCPVEVDRQHFNYTGLT
jgi:hypothetical protein